MRIIIVRTCPPKLAHKMPREGAFSFLDISPTSKRGIFLKKKYIINKQNRNHVKCLNKSNALLIGSSFKSISLTPHPVFIHNNLLPRLALNSSSSRNGGKQSKEGSFTSSLSSHVDYCSQPWSLWSCYLTHGQRHLQFRRPCGGIGVHFRLRDKQNAYWL